MYKVITGQKTDIKLEPFDVIATEGGRTLMDTGYYLVLPYQIDEYLLCYIDEIDDIFIVNFDGDIVPRDLYTGYYHQRVEEVYRFADRIQLNDFLLTTGIDYDMDFDVVYRYKEAEL